MPICQTEVNRLIAGRARLGELAALFSPGAEPPAPQVGDPRGYGCFLFRKGVVFGEASGA